ncbi:MAG TPA: YceI family protein [Burkholderiaceae bacterium]
MTAMSSLRRSCVAGLLCTVAFTAASAQAIDAARSAVSATFKQMGVPVEGKFSKFAGQVRYDPASPATAQASIDVDVASFDLGDAQYNQEVRGKEWFDAAQFPRASFVSTSVKPLAAGRLEVSGRLTLKGRTVDVNVPLSVRRDNGGASVFEGSVPVRRLAFGIGEGEWKDTGLLADEVLVKFKLVVAAGK